jgi:hypothetical protein
LASLLVKFCFGERVMNATNRLSHTYFQVREDFHHDLGRIYRHPQALFDLYATK